MFSRRASLRLLALGGLLALGLARPAVADCPKLSMGYYTSWSESYYPPSAIPFKQLTHIVHAFMQENADGSLSIPAGYLDPTLITLAHAAGVKVLVSIGGSSWSAAFPALAASAAARSNFADQVQAFCRTYGYDGVDVDWEFPDDATKSANFDALMQTLRDTFNAAPAPAPSWQITAALSGDLYYAGFLNLATLKNSLSYFNVMTYDYHGPWTNHSGHNAGLYASSMEWSSHPDADQSDSINYYLANGAPAAQLVMGLPFYGYNFPTAALYGSCSCAGTTSLPYSGIAPLVGAGWTYHFDASAQSPYLSNGSNVITYDDPNSIGIKAHWAINTAGLAGVFTWALDQGYLGPGNQPLLAAMSAQAFSCSTPTFTATPTRVLSATPTATPVVASTWRVNAGGPAYTDSLGRLWSADEDYSGGTAASTTQAVAGPDPTLFQSERYGTFTYTFAVPPGSYQLTLRFAEIYYTAAGQRLFNVAVNGSPVLSGFDIVQAAGGAFTPVDKVFDGVSPSGGVITISFTPGSADLPKLSALQIVPEPLPSPTVTRTASPSATAPATATPSPTRSPSATATRTASPSATATRTASASPSVTASPAVSAVGSVTPSAGPTGTPTATPPSLKASATVSAVGSVTPTPPASATAQATVGITPTVTVTATSVAATATASATPTVTATRAATATATTSVTLPATAPPSATIAASAMSTVAATATPTSTADPATATATPSRNATASPAMTLTLSPTRSLIPTRAPSTTPTRAVPGPGPLEIRQLLAVPNPDPTSFCIYLAGAADTVTVMVYSPAMVKVAELKAPGPPGPGWVRVDARGLRLSNGTWFLCASAQQGSRLALPVRPGRFCVLR